MPSRSRAGHDSWAKPTGTSRCRVTECGRPSESCATIAADGVPSLWSVMRWLAASRNGAAGGTCECCSITGKWNEVAGGGIASDLVFTRTSARVGFHQDGGTKVGVAVGPPQWWRTDRGWCVGDLLSKPRTDDGCHFVDRREHGIRTHRCRGRTVINRRALSATPHAGPTADVLHFVLPACPQTSSRARKQAAAMRCATRAARDGHHQQLSVVVACGYTILMISRGTTDDRVRNCLTMTTSKMRVAKFGGLAISRDETHGFASRPHDRFAVSVGVDKEA